MWPRPQRLPFLTPSPLSSKGLIKPDLDPKPLHKAIGPGKGCVVNIHYHLGTEHYNADSYSENGPEFLERALGCVPANYEGMDGYDPTKDTVFCCENYDRNHLACARRTPMPRLTPFHNLNTRPSPQVRG